MGYLMGQVMRYFRGIRIESMNGSDVDSVAGSQLPYHVKRRRSTHARASTTQKWADMLKLLRLVNVLLWIKYIISYVNIWHIYTYIYIWFKKILP